jgi:hypothetical protein
VVVAKQLSLIRRPDALFLCEISGLTTSIFVLAVVVGPAYGLGLLIGSRLFGFASETMFRRTCYALIAAAVVLGLPAMDGAIR